MADLEFDLDTLTSSASRFAGAADSSTETVGILQGVSVGDSAFGSTAASQAFASAVRSAREAHIASLRNIRQVNDTASAKLLAARRLGEELLASSEQLVR